MIKVDYSKARDLLLMDTGLIFGENESLMDFIYDNKISTVKDFLEVVDGEKFKRGRFVDPINEARGLADLLRFKYFDTPLIVDCYLNSMVVMENFKIYGESYRMPAVSNYNRTKVNLYSAITRLGFDDKERNIILDRDINFIIGRRFIDVLFDVYNEISNKEDISELEEIFINKLLLIICYHRKIFSLNKELLDGQCFNSELEELNALLVKKDIIDKRIEELGNYIFRRGVKR